MTAGRASFLGNYEEAAESARKFTKQLLERSKRNAALRQLVDTLGSLASAGLAAIRGRNPPKRSIACRPGCAYCCHLQVDVTAPEVLRLAEWVRSSLSKEEQSALFDKVRLTDARTRGMSSNERFLAGIPCPVLHADRCRAYPVRPLVCRSYTSYSWVACLRNHRVPRFDKDAPLGTTQLNFYDAIQEGLLVGLDDVGLKPQLLELNAALRIALETPDAADRWLAGEPLFESAIAPPESRGAVDRSFGR